MVSLLLRRMEERAVYRMLVGFRQGFVVRAAIGRYLRQFVVG